ncbi:hypothetical protein GCM10010971_27280 [Silvimonas amylolytica]|uniref:Uncharacterized protein n=1 Tax=Silvimonas amylolytica TaxID=449663 RepID=A0ABQ2PPM0_9NEIS|nr:hypothetical protein GCM10010971_27280 [Silvimonas amylolytica]
MAVSEAEKKAELNRQTISAMINSPEGMSSKAAFHNGNGTDYSSAGMAGVVRINANDMKARIAPWPTVN